MEAAECQRLDGLRLLVERRGGWSRNAGKCGLLRVLLQELLQESRSLSVRPASAATSQRHRCPRGLCPPPIRNRRPRVGVPIVSPARPNAGLTGVLPARWGLGRRGRCPPACGAEATASLLWLARLATTRTWRPPESRRRRSSCSGRSAPAIDRGRSTRWLRYPRAHASNLTHSRPPRPSCSARRSGSHPTVGFDPNRWPAANSTPSRPNPAASPPSTRASSPRWRL